MNLQKLSPEPTKYRSILKKHNFPVSHVASNLGLSYSHVLNVLNGISKLTPSVKEKLDSFVEQLQVKGEGD